METSNVSQIAFQHVKENLFRLNQEIVPDGRAHFYVTRPCHTTANEHHVTIHCVRPVYLFTTRQAAEVYIKLNYAEFGASADFSCEYTHKCKDIYLLTVN